MVVKKFGPEEFWFTVIFGLRRFWERKICYTEIFWLKFWVTKVNSKKVWLKKFGPKSSLVQKDIGPKKFGPNLGD